MKIAILSDIHANLEALQAVLTDMEQHPVDQVVHLGDLVGYGPDPEQVVTMIRRHQIPTVLGNHDIAMFNPKKLEWFNPIARDSLIRTRQLLSETSIGYLAGLKKALVIDDMRFVHGFPLCSPTIYLFQVNDRLLQRVFSKMDETVCFVGHTHELETVRRVQSGIHREALPLGFSHFSLREKYIFNLGSVGQPRDGSPEAKYGIWDTANFTLEVREVPYDVKKTARKIVAAGLPRSNASRLLSTLPETPEPS